MSSSKPKIAKNVYNKRIKTSKESRNKLRIPINVNEISDIIGTMSRHSKSTKSTNEFKVYHSLGTLNVNIIFGYKNFSKSIPFISKEPKCEIT